MKKAPLLLLILAMLTGCRSVGVIGGSDGPTEVIVAGVSAAAAEETAPELTPREGLSAPAVITEEREPAENVELPRQIWSYPIAEDAFPVMLAELPEAGAAFYGLQWETPSSAGETVMRSLTGTT